MRAPAGKCNIENKKKKKKKKEVNGSRCRIKKETER